MALLREAAQPVGVFVVDADASQRRLLAGLIAERTGGRFTATTCASYEEAIAAAATRHNAILVADLATIGGPTRVPEFARNGQTLIATSDTGSLSTAVAAVKAGAADFLPKPIGARALIERLDAAVAAWRPGAPAPSVAPSAELPVTAGGDFAGFVGRSPAMMAVYAKIRRMAPSRAPVFLTGESGTGKELAAEAIHAGAGTDGRPFVAINCSAIPRELMESEIFGHVRGAFTGATEHRAGAAELADGGTLFLDEIAEMDLGLQAKLLRFVQSGTLRRVGGTEQKRVSVRIVSATNRDLRQEVQAGRFRADLYYRLHVLPIHLPPLRDRRDDVPLLAAHFLARAAAEEGAAPVTLDSGTLSVLMARDWPGNVRELANAVRRMVVLGGDLVDLAEASMPATEALPAPGLPANPAVAPYRCQERQIIEAAIEAFGGSIARAAAALELSPSTLYRKRQAWLERRADGI
jgi:two-component system repressor protein LuxO